MASLDLDLPEISSPPAKNARVADKPARSGALVDLPTPKRRRGSQKDHSGLKTMLYGPQGSGKTDVIRRLLEMRYRVYTLTTDIGGTGLSTVETALTGTPLEPLLETHLLEMPLNTYDHVSMFVKNPLTFDPDFFAFDPDVLFWDGYGFAQQMFVPQYVGQNLDTDDTLRELGAQLETKDYGSVKKLSLDMANTFLNIKLPTGKPLHKFITAQENIRQKSKGSADPTKPTEWIDEHTPAISGAAGRYIGGAFDLIVRTGVRQKNRAAEQFAKNRGFVFAGADKVDPNAFYYVVDSVGTELPADWASMWRQMLAQRGYPMPPIDTEKIEKSETKTE